ncbi:MAG: sulfite exporter TauE/SafE family protein [Acidimicrobiia bacterium]|nr:sulfite exporter TauE/SafE family protein [Acidimicrobiia bacterium]
MTAALIEFAAAFAAGAVNSVAGGGTLITFPTLVWLGLPSITANATNTVAIWPGSIGAMWGYRRELRTTPAPLWVLAIPSTAGGMMGAILLQLTPTELFDRFVPILVLFATLLFMAQDALQRRLGLDARAPRDHGWQAGAIVFQFAVGLYGGYFGAGIGILMLAALSLLGLRDIHEMNGVKNLLGLCINGTAAIYFVAMDMVAWPAVFAMAGGAIAGGIGGAGMARRIGPKAVRRIVVGVGFGMTGLMALRLW